MCFVLGAYSLSGFWACSFWKLCMPIQNDFITNRLPMQEAKQPLFCCMLQIDSEFVFIREWMRILFYARISLNVFPSGILRIIKITICTLEIYPLLKMNGKANEEIFIKKKLINELK